jgi:uncharacterized membrane protein YkvA (DUF1232 family)
MSTAIYEEFDNKEFLTTVSKLAKRIGKTMLEKVLVAYYVLIDPSTPVWAQSTLVGALVYLGFPMDAIPDAIPVAGFSDDMAVLAAALAAVVTSIRWRHVKSARKTMRAWGFSTKRIPKSVDPDERAHEWTGR